MERFRVGDSVWVWEPFPRWPLDKNGEVDLANHWLPVTITQERAPFAGHMVCRDSAGHGFYRRPGEFYTDEEVVAKTLMET